MRMEVATNFIRLLAELGADPDSIKFKELEEEGIVNTVFTGVTPDMKTPRVEHFDNVPGIVLLEITPTHSIRQSLLFIKSEEIDTFLNYIESTNMSEEDIDRFLEDDDYQDSLGLSLKGFVLETKSFTRS